MTTRKMKKINFLIASMFLFVLMMGFAVAEFSVSTTVLTFNENTGTQTFTITNLNDSELLNVEFVTVK